MTDFKFLRRPPIKKQNQSPALIMLHGFGSNEADLFSFAEFLPQNLDVFSLRAPQKLNFGGFAWYDIFLDSENNKISDDQTALERVLKLNDFINYLIKAYDLNSKNINLLGFSQGAILSYALSLNYPENYKNIIALSGYINENIMPIQEDITKYKNLDFFISHGIYDEVIPVEWARKIPPYLKQRKISYTYQEYPMGHEVNPVCFSDMLNWLKNKV